MSVLGGKEIEILDGRYKNVKEQKPSSQSVEKQKLSSEKKGLSAVISKANNVVVPNKKPGSFAAEKSGPKNKDIVLCSNMSIADASVLLGLRLREIVPALLVMRNFKSIRDIVAVDEIERVADAFNIIIVVDQEAIKQSKNLHPLGYQEAFNPDLATGNAAEVTESKDIEKRDPVVVVMGHVDHGKTTLIDFIRKTKVVDREKGGITQKVHLYTVDSGAGKMVLIDTPGHEAFVAMRGKCVKAADIAIIIVAADDGIMPQTVESIKLAKQAGASIVVAVNKIDKPGVDQGFEQIKQQLSQHDLLVEEWGGDVVCVPISAKMGTGIDNLLEIVSLQAEMLELKSSTSDSCDGYILEASIEKGFGPVALAILKQGTLNKGDYFASGVTLGKVKNLVSMHGKPMTSAKPVDAVKITGFDQVPEVGSSLKVISKVEYEKYKSNPSLLAPDQGADLSVRRDDRERLEVVLKAESGGVVDAMKNSVEKMCNLDARLKGRVDIVATSTGDIFERDVLLASERSAVILGMNVKVDKKASIEANVREVSVLTGNIIYKIIDDFQELARSRLAAETQIIEIGAAKVLKVFDLKAKGIVAGCLVTKGSIIKIGKIYCMRGGVKIAEGSISSLQIERTFVDEVKNGQECGFVCKDIKVWQVGDQVLCVQEKEIN